MKAIKIVAFYLAFFLVCYCIAWLKLWLFGPGNIWLSIVLGAPLGLVLPIANDKFIQ